MNHCHHSKLIWSRNNFWSLSPPLSVLSNSLFLLALLFKTIQFLCIPKSIFLLFSILSLKLPSKQELWTSPSPAFSVPTDSGMELSLPVLEASCNDTHIQQVQKMQKCRSTKENQRNTVWQLYFPFFLDSKLQKKLYDSSCSKLRQHHQCNSCINAINKPKEQLSED